VDKEKKEKKRGKIAGSIAFLGLFFQEINQNKRKKKEKKKKEKSAIELLLLPITFSYISLIFSFSQTFR